VELGFVGTGLMGEPMAARLLDAGHTVTVFNRTVSKTGGLVERGARLAASAETCLVACDLTFVMLSDAEACRAVLSDGHEPLDHRLVVNMSTVAPEQNRELARSVGARGGRFLEAPVLGSTPQAAGGKLMVMAGGDPEDFERAKSYLQVFGEPRRVGPVGAGAAMKLACNHLIGAELTSFALSLGMVRRSGLDVDQWMEVLHGSVICPPLFDIKLENLRTREHTPPTFPTRHLLKDVRLGLEHARSVGLDAEGLDLLRTMLERAVDDGHADDDFSAVAETIDSPDGD